MKKIIQKIILAGVVINDGKILIIQRSKNDDSYPGLWEIPGGKKEPLESSIIALKREVKEETGLDVQLIKPIDIFDYQVEKLDEIRDATQISFLVKPINPLELQLSSEHQDYAWIIQSELEKYNISPETKNVLKTAFENQ